MKKYEDFSLGKKKKREGYQRTLSSPNNARALTDNQHKRTKNYLEPKFTHLLASNIIIIIII